jgi:signal transduction histidine kinase
MLTIIVLQLATAILLSGFGASIWYSERNRLRFGLMLFTISLSLWIAIGALANIESMYAPILNKLVFIFPFWIIFAAAYLIRHMAHTHGYAARFAGAAAIFITIISLGTSAIVADILPRFRAGQVVGYDIERGGLYPYYLGLLLVSALVVLTSLFLNYRSARGVKRDQLLVVGLGFMGTLVTGLILAVVIPLATGTSVAAEYSFLAGLISVGSFAYAIVMHGLFDIKLAIIRTVAYLFSLGTLSLAYFTLAYIASLTIFNNNLSTGFSISPANIVLALVLAFIFQPIKQFFDRITDRIFFRDRYNSDDFLVRLSEVLTSTTDLRALLQRSAEEIGGTLKAEQAFFQMTYDQGRKITAGTDEHGSFGPDDFEIIKHHLDKKAGTVIVAELLDERDPMKKILDMHKIAILMTLYKAGVVDGLFALGNQRSTRYTGRDVKVLGTIADELMIAVQNSLSIQEVRDINAHLEQRINEATSELRRSNKKLHDLDKSKDEFISMASHQLRTPLTAVKGYLSMVLEGDIGEISKEQRQVLEQAFDSSQRMVYLIGDFLNVSRIQTGKFMLEVTPVDLAQLIPEEVEQLIETASRRQIQIKYESDSELPRVPADENKLRQVMMNFMDNAIYYSRANSVINVRLYKDGSDIVFKVIDTGIGVPKSEQPHLFTKFYRATNARQQRPDGTGIGLYMAKKVIVAHGGSIIFETKEGVGSTFGFRLPLKNKLEQLEQQPAATQGDAGSDRTEAK